MRSEERVEAADVALPYGRVLYDYTKEPAHLAATTVLAAAE